jgi:hypothetical protein
MTIAGLYWSLQINSVLKRTLKKLYHRFNLQNNLTEYYKLFAHTFFWQTTKAPKFTCLLSLFVFRRLSIFLFETQELGDNLINLQGRKRKWLRDLQIIGCQLLDSY